MKTRAIILLVAVAIFTGLVLILPDVEGMKASRLSKSLPTSVGSWAGKPQEPGEKEKRILANDTEFERMQYLDTEGRLPSVEASVVFSGKNLSQSIHRPEVCLRAQGWQFISERSLSWEDLLPNGEALPVKEIVCRRLYQTANDEGDPEDVILKNGEKAYIWRVFYYTFVGHEKIVSGHYQRTGEDIKDRLFKGYDQRWAYATFSSFITKKHEEQGFNQGDVLVLDEKETENHIFEFLKKLLPVVIAPPGEGFDESLESGKDLGS
ncbi:MAG: hypothetical protein ACI8UZ_000174 [Akkermansiaceae bacterium]|jgi:hypothetical protein